VVAVDIPSGVDASTGIVEDIAVRARLTVTMGCRKVGHVVGDGREHSGEIRVVDIGIPPAMVVPPAEPTFVTGSNDVRSTLPVRPLRAHKYSVGKVFILGGSRGFTGAPLLAAASVLRAGAGAVILGIPRSIHPPMVSRAHEIILAPLNETAAGTMGASAEDEILERMGWADIVALGPGLGRNEETDALLRRLVGACPRTLILDADGLTAMAGHTPLLQQRTSPTILTPHTGELQRLVGIPAADLEIRRVEQARSAARTLRCIVSLKGSPTVTAAPTGAVVVNPTGNPGMATIGSGDVLTGVVAGLAAQGMEPFSAAWAGVFLHGTAGDLAAAQFGERSIVATDILEHVAAALRSVERGS
jgi:NAD(P)H-hydrate epimerase